MARLRSRGPAARRQTRAGTHAGPALTQVLGAVQVRQRRRPGRASPAFVAQRNWLRSGFAYDLSICSAVVPSQVRCVRCAALSRCAMCRVCRVAMCRVRCAACAAAGAGGGTRTHTGFRPAVCEAATSTSSVTPAPHRIRNLVCPRARTRACAYATAPRAQSTLSLGRRVIGIARAVSYHCALRGLGAHAPATAALSLPLTLTGVCIAELGRDRDDAELNGAGRDVVGADRSLRH